MAKVTFRCFWFDQFEEQSASIVADYSQCCSCEDHSLVWFSKLSQTGFISSLSFSCFNQIMFSLA